MEQPVRSNERLSIHDRAVEALIDRALLIIEHDYGPLSPEPKPYHGPDHTKLVLAAAEQLSNAAVVSGKITPPEKQLLKIAAAYHDVVHDSDIPDNEEQSAAVVARRMNMLGIFSQSEIERVVQIILATKVKEQTADCLQQSVNEDDYLTMLMADADLSSLGSPVETYWDMAQRYFTETHPGQQLTGEALRKFMGWQLAIVDGHRYYTQEARELFKHRGEIIEFLDGELAAT